ncbi:hypothetical protein C2G38_2221925 [Gigaspora rosea]|uniref:Uncharacterized protein n=1 Tax=Gigaspora rosea TaxID=44941 RepID=A0A397UBX9_9GLOM|nr:hypothetical protein C2G38_2221925 [Gigaspora rosea]
MPKAPIYKVPFETFVNIFDNLDDNLDALHFAQTFEKTVRKRVKKTQKGEYFCNSPFQSNEKLLCVKEQDIEKCRCENCYLLKKCGMMYVYV